MNSVQFQGSAESLGFRPIQVSSKVQGLEDNARREEAALARNFQLQQSYDRANQFVQNGNIQSLAGFSETLANFLTQETQKRNQQQMEEGLSLAYTEGVDPVEQMAFDIAENHLRGTDDQIQKLGDEIQASGQVDFLGVQRFRELSGWKQYGFSIGMAQKASMAYQGFVDQALANMDPEATAADKAAMLAQVRNQFFSQSGLLEINPALLNKHAFPEMREVDGAYLNRWRKEDIARQQEAMVGEAQEILGADPSANFGKALDTLVRSGKFNRTTARDALLEMITDPDDIDAIGSSMSWDGVKTWAEKYPLQFAKARREAIKREADGYETDKAEVALEGKRWFDQVQELWEQEPPSEQEIEEAKRKMSDDFDYIDPRLERWVTRSTDAEAKAYYSKQFEVMDRAGTLTEDAVNAPDVPDEVRRRYLQIAQQQDKARKEVPEYKQYGKQLEADLKRLTQTEGLQPGPPGLELALAKAQGDFNRYYMAAVQAGQSPIEAAQNAYSRVSADIQQGFNGVGQYKFSGTDGFTDLVGKGFGTGWEKHRESINKKLQYGGVASLDKFALIPAPILQDAIENSNNPNYQMPAIAQYISDLTGGTVSPWAVLDRQAKAQQLGGLVPNPRLQSQVHGLRPEFPRLLTYKPSHNRTSRAYASTGSFNPDRIPQGYGQVVLEAATQHGIDPAILAGLIETESSWNPNARSEAGAVGIAQIVPKWHPTADPTNPKAAIFYAAKHLAGLRAALGGNMDEAIYAYNGGTGGIRKSAENRAYHPKVMKAAAKYGYNPTGNPWSNPVLLNPRVAYITGNIGPTSTGPHLDVKQVGGGNFAANALDNFVQVDDPEYGRVPLSRVGVTADQANHRRRGSHGIDYGTASGSRVYLKNGARVVSSVTTEHGDKLTIKLPNGQQYTFLHGRRA